MHELGKIDKSSNQILVTNNRMKENEAEKWPTKKLPIESSRTPKERFYVIPGEIALNCRPVATLLQTVYLKLSPEKMLGYQFSTVVIAKTVVWAVPECRLWLTRSLGSVVRQKIEILVASRAAALVWNSVPFEEGKFSNQFIKKTCLYPSWWKCC